jgi:hypothetical protein
MSLIRADDLKISRWLSSPLLLWCCQSAYASGTPLATSGIDAFEKGHAEIEARPAQGDYNQCCCEGLFCKTQHHACLPERCTSREVPPGG